MANEASWIKEPRANVEIGSAPIYTPGLRDVLVKVESIGFNPVEPKIQKYHYLI
jgi:NADPH:quinone reductase-like Zn-dependent oxidoreductase